MPGESPSIFGDALRRLSGSATYLYQDGSRYWYSTQPTVTKIADDRAEELKRNADPVMKEIDKRLRADLTAKGDFCRVHPLPMSGQDVPDDLDARLVVLSTEHPYSKQDGSPAESAAKAIFEARGNMPRLYRNTLIFLAADTAKLQDLDEAVRRYLAWDSILKDKESLDLSPHQVKQAETQKASADSAVTARIPETYQWMLAPAQETPQSAVTWQSYRLSGQEALAVRASKKLKNDSLLVAGLAPTSLRLELDRVPLWRGDHVAVKQLVEDFAQYLYLPRLKEPAVLIKAVSDGLGLLTWMQDSFAYADSYDEDAGRYRALRSGQAVSIPTDNMNGMLVRPDAAKKQQEAEKKPDEVKPPDTSAKPPESGGEQPPVQPVQQPKPKRFHGSVKLDPARVGRDAGRIADEVISHLAGLVGANVRVILEIEAEVPDGVSETVVRTVTENSRTLKFDSQGFEKE